MSRQLVLITGASGHLGFRVLVDALEAGYRVRAPVRRPEQIQTITAVASIHNYLQNLEFAVIPDILIEGAYGEALKGVDYVIHVASPLAIPTENYERDIIAPAIQGTVGILNSALEIPTIKRVVITSSVNAIIPWENIGLVESEQVFNDRDSTPAVSGPFTHPFEAYSASKVHARHATDDFVATKHPKFDIINIMPSFIIGKNELANFETIENGTNKFALVPLRGYVNTPVVGATVYLNDVSKVHVLSLDPKILTQKSPFYDHFITSSGGVDGTDFNDSIKIYKEFFDGKVDEKLFPLTGNQPRREFRLDSSRTEEVFGFKLAGYETQVKSVLEHYASLAPKAN